MQLRYSAAAAFCCPSPTSARCSDSPNGATDELNIVVLQADDRCFGLVVDGINDTQEIVVKPLGSN